MQKKILNKNSILFRVTLLILVTMILQALVFVGVVYSIELPTTVESYAYGLFSKTIDNRTNYLAGEMLNQWSNITTYSSDIVELYDQQLALSADGRLSEDDKVDFICKSVPTVLEIISSSGSTGAFIILDDSNDSSRSNSSLYIMSEDVATKSSSSLEGQAQLVFGPADVAKEYRIPIVSSWSHGMTLDDEHLPILSEPIRAAGITDDDKYRGYWHVSTSFDNPNTNMITFSLPLVDAQGNVFGVFGTEVSQAQLYRHLPFDELTSDDSYGYTVASLNENTGEFTPLIKQGTVQQSLFKDGVTFTTDMYDTKHDCYVMDSSLGSVTMHPSEISLYAPNTPFANNELYLIGIAGTSAVSGMSQTLSNMLMIIVAISLIIGVFAAYAVSFSFTRPILRLSAEVQNSSAGEAIALKRTGLTEIDNLSSSVEQLNHSLLEWVSKSDKILQMTRIRVGTFEYKKGSEVVSVSSTLLTMLDLEMVSSNNFSVQTDKFFDVINAIKDCPEESMENTYLASTAPNCWLRINETLIPDGILGVVVDVTKEVLERRALNYERDYDMLTGINNRLAFRRKATAIFSKGELGVAAVAMFDLDNLKYVNDTFGHDIGDVYIRTAAKMLSDVFPSNTIIGRMSGDEFFAFFHNFKSKDEVLFHLHNVYKSFDQDPIVLLDGSEFKIRMSGGVSWYGDDSNDFDELIRFADFAMYEGKHTVKGELRMFDKDIYMAESFMLSGKEELNRILDNQFVEFAFQPIVEAKTGALYAYEALMRPQSEVLNTPIKLLQIAAAQSQLWKIERITFFKAMSSYVKYRDMFGDAKLFINSIPSETLKDSEYTEFERLFGDHLENLVVEIIENERLNPERFKQKLDKINSWGSKVALDDYGSGYNSDLNLLNINPHIIKLDRSLITYVESDETRQALVDKIIDFSKERGMLVLAEGVETAEQMEYLINVGVDFLQGYYIAKPMPIPQFDNTKIADEIGRIISDSTAVN